MKRFVFTLTGLIIAIALSFAWYQAVHAPVATLVPVVLTSPQGEEVALHVEVTDDTEERTVGLMGRRSLPSGQGMVFVFDEPEIVAFWMRHTLIPLDILYFDADGKFVSRTTMSPCTTEDCPTYASDKPSAFALEVNAGEPQTAPVGEGWKLTIDRE